MKTLNEVIKAFECCENGESDSNCKKCSYIGIGSCCLERENDALRYMKEYREKHDEILKMEEALGYCEIMDNQPLTWDELKGMEGMPVWYEHEFWKGWIILGKVEQGVNCEMIPDREERWYIVKDGSAKSYRRERK